MARSLLLTRARSRTARLRLCSRLRRTRASWGARRSQRSSAMRTRRRRLWSSRPRPRARFRLRWRAQVLAWATSPSGRSTRPLRSLRSSMRRCWASIPPR
eukprot:Amastigsp_a680067_7.p4 type:complete len:100 gc:universal Amastigsp_a680067_7:502-203(-)